MDSPEVMEGFLIRSGMDYEQISEGTWVLHDDEDHVDNIVIQLTPPLVVFTVRLMDLPQEHSQQHSLFKKLLELNAKDMVSGAYAIDDGGIIVTETLQSESIDYNEFQAAVDSLTMAVSGHYQALKGYHHAPAQEASA